MVRDVYRVYTSKRVETFCNFLLDSDIVLILALHVAHGYPRTHSRGQNSKFALRLGIYRGIGG